MVAAGYIDQKTADQSAAVDIHGDAYEGKSEDYRLPILYLMVINEVVNNEYGLTEEDIKMPIHTIDQITSKHVQVIYDTHSSQ